MGKTKPTFHLKLILNLRTYFLKQEADFTETTTRPASKIFPQRLLTSELSETESERQKEDDDTGSLEKEKTLGDTLF